jgi:predicted PurR-regulated permease PerM
MRRDLTRLTLAIIFIVGLIGTTLWILRPFLPAMIWAATLVIATWPLMIRLQSKLWNSRGLATAVMTATLLLVFIVPFWLALGTIIGNRDQILVWASWMATADVPPPPDWLAQIPLIGQGLAGAWENISDAGTRELLQKVRPYAGMLTQWFIGAIGGFGMLLLQFALTLLLSAIVFLRGELAGATATRFAQRLAGERGAQSVILAAKAIRGVALGVIVTAFIQSGIGAIALFVASVPYAPVLCAIMFMLCVAQLGPGLVLIPAVIWMYADGDAAMATFLLVCSLVAIGSDNLLRPILIRRGVDLPILLILLGVIGGLIAFGLIGIFLGPTVLAVSYTLLGAWIDQQGNNSAIQE